MAKFGFLDKFIAIIHQFHDGMNAKVLDDVESFQLFPVNNGVKQRCVLTRTLFSMVFSVMLTVALRDGDISVGHPDHTHGKLFQHRRFQANTKVYEDTSRDFLFADECAHTARAQSDMQGSAGLFSAQTCRKTGALH